MVVYCLTSFKEVMMFFMVIFEIFVDHESYFRELMNFGYLRDKL